VPLLAFCPKNHKKEGGEENDKEYKIPNQGFNSFTSLAHGVEIGN
jgi:hypothetical protein